MTETKYPQTEGFAPGWARTELNFNGQRVVAVTKINADQPTEEGAVRGACVEPIDSTEGEMGLGSMTITFSTEEARQKVIAKAGNAWREKKFTVKYTLKAKGRSDIKFAYYGVRILAEPVDHGQGTDALGGDLVCSFMSHTRNGLSPHSGAGAAAS